MWVIRLLLALVGIAIALSLVLYFVSGDRRYLRMLWAELRVVIVLAVMFGVLALLARVA